MSDYFGDANLEDWLYEEVFDKITTLGSADDLPEEIVAMFEKWRRGVEASILGWMESVDEAGNPTSWRGWDRGFEGIPDDDEALFDKLVKLATTYMTLETILDVCSHGHEFARMNNHPLKKDGQPHCLVCLAAWYDEQDEGDHDDNQVTQDEHPDVPLRYSLVE